MSAEIGILIGVILAIAAVFIVTTPLRQSAIVSSEDETKVADLLTQRDAAYQVLRDLDSDFQVGKLSEDDYRPMRVQALAHAAEIVAQLDAYQKSRVSVPSPTSQVTSSKSRSRKSQFANSHPERVEGRNSDAFCPKCSAPYAPDDAFCRKCGRSLQIVEQTSNREDAKSTKGR